MSGHPPRRSPLWLPVLAGTLAVACMVGAVLVLGLRSPQAAVTAQGSCSGPSTTLAVLAAPQHAAVLDGLARGFVTAHPTVGDRCAEVRVNALPPAEVAGRLAEGWSGEEAPPDVWVPPSSVWLHPLDGEAADLVAGRQPSLARSPLVIAMPRPMATALGWPEEPLGWADLAGLAADPDGWAAHGHPEWGEFTFGMTDPASSTAGLHALLSMYAETTGQPTALPATALTAPETTGAMRPLERALTPQKGDTTEVLTALQQADGTGEQPLSAFPASEQAVLAYNRGGPERTVPQVPLVAVYPEHGAPQLDLPYLVLNADWVTDDRRQLAAAFLDYLHSDAGWERLRQAGFRAPGTDSGFVGTEADGVLPGQRAPVQVRPAADVISLATERWAGLRAAGSTLLVLDTSGSMAAATPDPEVSRLELAGQSIARGLGTLGDGARMGLWTFSEAAGEAAPQQELVAPEPLGDAQREALTTATGDLTPSGGTALYGTTLNAVRAVREAWQPDGANTVVVLTDGTDEDADSISLEELVATLEREADPERPVRVLLLVYDPEADLEPLRTIAGTTGGAVHVVTDPAVAERAFLDVLTR